MPEHGRAHQFAGQAWGAMSWIRHRPGRGSVTCRSSSRWCSAAHRRLGPLRTVGLVGAHLAGISRAPRTHDAASFSSPAERLATGNTGN